MPSSLFAQGKQYNLKSDFLKECECEPKKLNKKLFFFKTLLQKIIVKGNNGRIYFLLNFSIRIEKTAKSPYGAIKLIDMS